MLSRSVLRPPWLLQLPRFEGTLLIIAGTLAGRDISSTLPFYIHSATASPLPIWTFLHGSFIAHSKVATLHVAEGSGLNCVSSVVSEAAWKTPPKQAGKFAGRLC